MAVNQQHSRNAVLFLLHVLNIAQILPTKYNGIKICVAGSNTVKLSVALAATRITVSNASTTVAVGSFL